MQAGRWFGFRPGYQDLVRLYIRRDDNVDLYEAFEALLLDEEAFRDELGKYEGLDEDGKPIARAAADPAARQPAPALAQADGPQQDVERRHRLEGHGWRLPGPLQPSAPRGCRNSNQPRRRRSIADAVGTNVRHAPFRLDGGCPGQRDIQDRHRSRADDFSRHCRATPGTPTTTRSSSPFKAFLRRPRRDGRITEWMVALAPAQQGRSPTVDLPGLGPSPIVTRRRRAEPRIDFIGSDRKHTKALEPIAAGLDVRRPAGCTRAVASSSSISSMTDPRSNAAHKQGPLNADHDRPAPVVRRPTLGNPPPARPDPVDRASQGQGR